MDSRIKQDEVCACAPRVCMHVLHSEQDSLLECSRMQGKSSMPCIIDFEPQEPFPAGVPTPRTMKFSGFGGNVLVVEMNR